MDLFRYALTNVVAHEQQKERSFYTSKFCLSLNEHGGMDLEEFCKIERVSYTKVCNCLGRPSYRSPGSEMANTSGLVNIPVVNLIHSALTY